MSGIYIVLLFLGLFGFLPLAIILKKRSIVRRILTSGLPAKARVYDVRTNSRSATDIVYYTFYANNTTEQYTGILTTKVGQYKTGDVIDVYYLPGNPRRNTMQGAWQSNGILVFGIAIALFILFAVYKLYEMIQSGAA